MKEQLQIIEEALNRIQQSAGAKMDFGSNDSSHQLCYNKSNEALNALQQLKEGVE